MGVVPPVAVQAKAWTRGGGVALKELLSGARRARSVGGGGGRRWHG